MQFLLPSLLVGASCLLTTLTTAFVLPQRSALSFSTTTASSCSSRESSVRFAKNGEFSVVEEDDNEDENLGYSIVDEDEEEEDTIEVVDDASSTTTNTNTTGQRLEYAAFSPGTATTLQIQVGDLALARKAWKKRRRSGSPLLVPCSVLHILDRPSLVRDNLLYLLYKFGTGQKDGVVISLAELKRRHKSHLKGNLSVRTSLVLLKWSGWIIECFCVALLQLELSNCHIMLFASSLHSPPKLLYDRNTRLPWVMRVHETCWKDCSPPKPFRIPTAPNFLRERATKST